MLRSANLKRALLLSAVSVAWSGIIGCVATYAALTTGALSLLGFGVDAVIDAVASVALMWRFRVESDDPGRAAAVEHAAERVVGLALLGLALYLVIGALRAISSESHPEASNVGTVILLASVIVLPALARAKFVTARALGSGALRLDSILTAVAGLLAVISLVSLIAAAAMGLWWTDAVAALVVAAILGREGWAGVRAGLPPSD